MSDAEVIIGGENQPWTCSRCFLKMEIALEDNF